LQHYFLFDYFFFSAFDAAVWLSGKACMQPVKICCSNPPKISFAEPK